jgi:hypothetical protein
MSQHSASARLVYLGFRTEALQWSQEGDSYVQPEQLLRGRWPCRGVPPVAAT